MTEEEGKEAAKVLLEGIIQRHRGLLELYTAWNLAYGNSAGDAFQQGIIMGYKCAWDDEKAGIWPKN